MKKVHVTVGLPGSGKSTWALEQLQKHPGMYKRVNKDLLRAMLDGGQWSKANEAFVLLVRDSLILQAIVQGKHVIVDDTNLHPKHIERIRELVKGQAEVVVVDHFLQVPIEECIKRDLARPQSVGEAVIRKMHKQFLAPKPPTIAYNPSIPDAIICDLDGTLSLHNGRDPYDASTCDQDVINEAVLGVLMGWHTGHILFVSGRKEEFRPQTLKFLERCGFGGAGIIVNWALHMRATGDNRNDAIVKKEIYEREIQGKYNIKFVMDDRNRVVDLWRSLGLTCFQVAEGDF